MLVLSLSNSFFLQQVFLHSERKTPVTSESSPSNKEKSRSAIDSAAKQGLPEKERAPCRKPGRHGRKTLKGHSQLCKQLSYHPAKGCVRKAVRRMEGPLPFCGKPPLQHRLSVAQLADAALVVSRAKEFEGHTNPESPDKVQLPSPQDLQPGEDHLLSPTSGSRSRRMVRQTSIDMGPSSG